MKNVQIIDPAINCVYPIYQFTDEEFLIVFPDLDQEIEFIEDVVKRFGEDKISDLFSKIWLRETDRVNAMGIHGTLFYQMIDRKKYFPKKRWDSAIIYRSID